MSFRRSYLRQPLTGEAGATLLQMCKVNIRGPSEPKNPSAVLGLDSSLYRNLGYPKIELDCKGEGIDR